MQTTKPTVICYPSLITTGSPPSKLPSRLEKRNTQIQTANNQRLSVPINVHRAFCNCMEIVTFTDSVCVGHVTLNV